jgi:DNA-directed RNA polymerase subunit RPC12/RpoP
MESIIGLCGDCGHEITYTLKDGVITPPSCICGMKFHSVITSKSCGSKILLNK